MSNDIRELTQRKLNFIQTLKAVAWGMFGVRKRKGHNKDIATLNPVHLIIAGILAAVFLVIGLVKVARWFAASVT